ncbi:hypothetical protein FQN52_003184 [Onygenales sp. PD_12]|nr:hypothetical protein FQN52_003184 [Onygenales sp. PD_12]
MSLVTDPFLRLLSAFYAQWHILATAIVLLATLNLARSILRAINSPFPGPKLAKLTKWWRRYHELRDNLVQLTHSAHQKYGPIAQISPDEISFCHPDALRDIYTGPHGGLDVIEDVWLFEQYGSENLVSTVDAELHLTRRKNTAGLYTSPVVASAGSQALMKRCIDMFVGEIEKEAEFSRTVDIFPLVRWLTSDVMIGLIYGAEGSLELLRNKESRDSMGELLVSNTQQLADPFLTIMQWFPAAITKRISLLFNPESKMAAFGMSRVQEALKSTTSNNNEGVTTHLQHLLHLYRKKGSNAAIPNTTYIASDCLDHFFAGSSTTADFLSALFWNLSLPENKRYQDRLQHELRTAGIIQGTEVDLSTIQQLPYLNCVLRETLRTDPPIPFGLPRVVKEKNRDVTVMGIRIKPGTTISTQPYSIHRDPNTFHNPDVWDPDRWDIPITSPAYRQMLRMFMPFGYGARMCPGINVAWAEIRLVTARIYSMYETSLGEVFFDKEGGRLLEEEKRKDLFPASSVQPIVFRRIKGSG